MRSGRALLHLARATVHAFAATLTLLHGIPERARPRPRFDPARVRRILVIRLDLLGDLICSLPAVQALRQRYPGARIDLLVLPAYADLARSAAPVDTVLALDVNAFRRPRGWRGWRPAWQTLRALRQARYDAVLALHGEVASFLAVWTGAPWRAGYAGESLPLALTLPLPGDRLATPRHEAQCCLDLCGRLGARAVLSSPALVPEPAAQATIRALLARHGLPPGQPYLVIHPGAGNGAAKRWLPARWAAVADRLRDELGLAVLLTGASSERSLTAAVRAAMHGPAIDLAGATPLPLLTALLAGARLVLGGDTGPLHLAAALGVPTVSVFGPTDPAHYAPLGPRARVARRVVPCGPCYDLSRPADCRLPDRSALCMALVGPEEVLAAARALATTGSRT